MSRFPRVAARTLTCLAPLLAAGCIPFFASSAMYLTSFEGRVTGPGGAPVAGAAVSVWGITSPGAEPRGTPDHSAVTDGNGRYRVEERRQEMFAVLSPAFLVSVTPRPGSGLKARRLEVVARDVTYENRENRSGDRVIRRRVDVALEPASP